MEKFIHDDFLLTNKQARELYHEFAENLPIIDYHSHLDPKKIATDYQFTNITEAWLAGDHYKWRALRSLGVDERYCTGDASDREKFDQWAASMPALVRNPLYHWAHLELRRPFGIDDCLLSSDTAERVWNDTNAMLASGDFGAHKILRKMNVEIVCTTDDPVDSLRHHKAFAESGDTGLRLFPTWRPDRARNLADTEAFLGWIERLNLASGIEVTSLETYLEALRKRHDFFHDAGCRVSDHSIEAFGDHFPLFGEANIILAHALKGEKISLEGQRAFSLFMLHEFGKWDAERGWTQQYHLGALRNPNAKAFQTLGPDTGFDGIADFTYACPFAKHLGRLAEIDRLAKTVVYNLNPRDNEMLAVLCGSFNYGTSAGKVQFGAAWWFLDQMDGIKRHLETVSQLNVLSRFLGMLTDSRSFLSFTRHEYFRRILCNMLGKDMENGIIPNDIAFIGKMVTAICHDNAQNFFNFPQK